MAQIDPVVAPPLFPEGQKSFATWLFSGLTQKPDGGWNLNDLVTNPNALTADPSKTRLPDVWNAWNSQDPGVNALLSYFGNNGVGQHDPLSDQMMKWGGSGGIGNNYMNLMAQYGGPSAASLPMSSLALNGMSSPGAGGNLANFAQGNPVGSAQFLVPFLTGQAGAGQGPIPHFEPGYRAPNIQGRTVQRSA